LQGGGTSVSYVIYQYEKTEDVNIPGQKFDLPDYTFRIIDRRGEEIITNTTESPTAMPMMALTAGASDDNVVNYLQQNEGISFNIEYFNGSTEQGEI